MSSWPSNPILRLCSDDQVEEARQLGLLPHQVGVEQRVVALAAAPQDVVLAAQPLGHLEHVLDLRRGVGEHLGIGVGRGAALVARMGEQVRGAPQELDPGPLLVAQGVIDERVEVRSEGREAVALGCDVAVVEAVVRDAQLAEELERDGHPVAGAGHLVGVGEPWTVERADAEHVPAVPRERVPEARARAEPVHHPLAQDDPVGLVHLERQGVGGVEAAERDGAGDVGEKGLAHRSSSGSARSATRSAGDCKRFPPDRARVADVADGVGAGITGTIAVDAHLPAAALLARLDGAHPRATGAPAPRAGRRGHRGWRLHGRRSRRSSSRARARASCCWRRRPWGGAPARATAASCIPDSSTGARRSSSATASASARSCSATASTGSTPPSGSSRTRASTCDYRRSGLATPRVVEG